MRDTFARHTLGREWLWRARHPQGSKGEKRENYQERVEPGRQVLVSDWDGFQWGSDLWNNGEISDAKGSG